MNLTWSASQDRILVERHPNKSFEGFYPTHKKAIGGAAKRL
jgi:hypothetical protein